MKISWYCSLVTLSVLMFWVPIPILKSSYYMALGWYLCDLALWYFFRWVYEFDLKRIARQKVRRLSLSMEICLVLAGVVTIVALAFEWGEVAVFGIFAAIFAAQDLVWAKCDRDAFQLSQTRKAS
jgi:hypothetical protein